MDLKNRTVFLISILISLISCERESQKFNDSQVFKYNEHRNINTLDPAFSKDLRTIWATNQLFNGLVQLDDSLQVIPDIAANWTISEDGKNYEFHLRKDVFFHQHALFGKDSTRNVVAKDFEYSFQRLLDPEIASPGKWVLEFVTDFSAKNDSTFQVQLKEPFPPFLSLLTMKYCSVVPKEAIDFFGDTFRANPIGTGPFRFKLWKENIKLVFRKNHHYFEYSETGVQLPYLEAVAITFLPDKQSEFLQFIQGNLDFLNSIDNSYKDDLLTKNGILQPNYAAQIDMLRSPYLNTEYLGVYMDAEEEEANSLLIRKAMNYGFDKEKMILYLRNGIGTPALNGFIPKGLPSFNHMEGYSYQPQKAKQLIDAYKLQSGNQNPKITISTDSQYLDLCEFIQREMQKVGLEVAIDVMPPSTLREQKANGQLSIFRGSWVADYPDAENYLFIYHSKNFSPNGPNYTHYKNDTFDSLYEKAVATIHTKNRHRLYQKMDSLMMESAPVIPLYYDEAVRFTNKNISGLGINPINHLHLKRVQKKELIRPTNFR
ncbi:ABC transporter substrate-binding protein [Polaribacter sp. HL-MS24]|uniref:ABC transporter substrate-binding protein n=1 Tax=Polaribacter sp. HL-MS24 TaxID=3077735 RepID=UPI002934C0D0|nr:ABC transporter substrate-binding protein [Polaribacter sp. HL-MS24]WOC40352.1 ABC transporter substrate-binding protein [Polaribacter sp. HL-MS24]